MIHSAYHSFLGWGGGAVGKDNGTLSNKCLLFCEHVLRKVLLTRLSLASRTYLKPT